MIDTPSLFRALDSGFRPLPGRCIIKLDTPATMSGSLHLPEVSQERRLIHNDPGTTVGNQAKGDSIWPGTVVSVSHRKNHKTGLIQVEEFSAGDKVYVALLWEDMEQEVIVTRNERVWAKV